MKKNQEELNKLITDAATFGKIARGTLEVIRSIEKKNAKMVIIAENFDVSEITKSIETKCKNNSIPYTRMFSKKELGQLSGLNTSAGMISIIQPGENLEQFQKTVLSLHESDYLKKIKITKAPQQNGKKPVVTQGWNLPQDISKIEKIEWQKGKNNVWTTTYYFVAKA